MKYTILTTLGFLAATSASAWEVQNTIDAFTNETNTIYYSNGKTLQSIGDRIAKAPVLHFYPDNPNSLLKWALLPGDGYVCRVSTGINAQMKIDGKLVKGEVKSIKNFGITAIHGFPFEHIPMNPSLSSSALTPFVQDPAHYLVFQELTWLPEAIFNADNVVIKYVDGCGNGGVFEFDNIQAEMS